MFLFAAFYLTGKRKKQFMPDVKKGGENQDLS
jgi:hypothetical protein